MSIRALIADDEPKLAEYLAGRLAELWPELELCGIAVNGNDALTKIQGEKPDLVFLDIKMPGISGLEIARRMTLIRAWLSLSPPTTNTPYMPLKKRLSITCSNR